LVGAGVGGGGGRLLTNFSLKAWLLGLFWPEIFVNVKRPEKNYRIIRICFEVEVK